MSASKQAVRFSEQRATKSADELVDVNALKTYVNKVSAKLGIWGSAKSNLKIPYFSRETAIEDAKERDNAFKFLALLHPKFNMFMSYRAMLQNRLPFQKYRLPKDRTTQELSVKRTVDEYVSPLLICKYRENPTQISRDMHSSVKGCLDMYQGFVDYKVSPSDSFEVPLSLSRALDLAFEDIYARCPRPVNMRKPGAAGIFYYFKLLAVYDLFMFDRCALNFCFRKFLDIVEPDLLIAQNDLIKNCAKLMGRHEAPLQTAFELRQAHNLKCLEMPVKLREALERVSNPNKVATLTTKLSRIYLKTEWIIAGGNQAHVFWTLWPEDSLQEKVKFDEWAKEFYNLFCVQIHHYNSRGGILDLGKENVRRLELLLNLMEERIAQGIEDQEHDSQDTEVKQLIGARETKITEHNLRNQGNQ